MTMKFKVTVHVGTDQNIEIEILQTITTKAWENIGQEKVIFFNYGGPNLLALCKSLFENFKFCLS